ncbi:MAG: DUF2058 family protein [Steroidobacteraceae bacterium]|jgi:uncharacterized protein YaiL (DUF2058 family)
MSTSLRDQLLQAGLISQQQANEAERQQQRQEQRQHQRPAPRRDRPAQSRPPQRPQQQKPLEQAKPPASAPNPVATAERPLPSNSAQSAKFARDLALNRRQQEKADKKARLAQLKQLIAQHRIPPSESGEPYHFTDGAKIRQIQVDAAQRAGLGRGEIVIVCLEGHYDLVPAALIDRLRERDPQIFIAAAGTSSAESDQAYGEFSVPDDLIW